MTSWRCLWCSALLVASTSVLADVDRRTLNDGNLILEDIPEIPREVFLDLYRFQNVRAAAFRSWTADSQSIYVSTGFGDVDSIHRVDMPLGARRQVTFYEEPVGGIAGRPGSDALVFTQDAGGSEFAQIFLLEPVTGEAEMLSDGESRNGAVVWDRRGARIAFQSTRRNGAANDVWVMDPDDHNSAEIVLTSPDGSWWGPAEFSASGSKILVTNYVSVTDSRVHLVDLDTGSNTLLSGGPENKSVNGGASPEIITADISWGVTGATISHDRQRMVFVTNEDGMSHVYLLDVVSRKYRKIDSIPTGLAYGLQFSPDDRRLAMTLNTPQTPSDTYVLELGEGALEYGDLIRWTESEVGGLDTTAFRIPELVHYPTFDMDGAAQREIPAWVYKPAGKGPHPVVSWLQRLRQDLRRSR